ncbi:hypothetical protein MTR67_017837 [Solanum verrucosum]|uniref:Uncharacterized protein n=1 Tax=Solanum verrucosum TaxID=315347 RepID=A0AAF0QKL7_SOLVR|nr:hypothetical protein MTR67_017837 [Solanum verrucosum]
MLGNMAKMTFKAIIFLFMMHPFYVGDHVEIDGVRIIIGMASVLLGLFRTNVKRDIEHLNRIRWSVWITHTMNLQDMGERWAKTSLLVEEMVKIFRELDIEYRMLHLDVNVHNMPQLSSSGVPSNWSLCA